MRSRRVICMCSLFIAVISKSAKTGLDARAWAHGDHHCVVACPRAVLAKQPLVRAQKCRGVQVAKVAQYALGVPDIIRAESERTADRVDHLATTGVDHPVSDVSSPETKAREQSLDRLLDVPADHIGNLGIQQKGVLRVVELETHRTD